MNTPGKAGLLGVVQLPKRAVTACVLGAGPCGPFHAASRHPDRGWEPGSGSVDRGPKTPACVVW